MGQNSAHLSTNGTRRLINARPLRFVVAVLALWGGTRVAIHWPGRSAMAAPEQMAHSSGRVTPVLPTKAAGNDRILAKGSARNRIQYAQLVTEPDTIPLRAPITVPLQTAELSRRNTLLAYARGGGPLLALLSLAGVQGGLALSATSDMRIATPVTPAVSRRLSGYSWFFARNGESTGLAGGGQLGGSQAGIRLDYVIARGFALTGRISAPIETRMGSEAALGLNWRPVNNLPVTLTIERRVALDKGGRDAFAAMASGGIGPIDAPGGFKLEAYGQAGIVGIKRRDGFIDGAATLTRPVTDGRNSSLALGGGIWGAAQPDISRLDIGPRVKFRLNSGAASIGASIDWRRRVAGNADPQSGVALTIDGSF